MKPINIKVLFAIGDHVKIMGNVDGVVRGWYITGKNNVRYDVAFLDGNISKADYFYACELFGTERPQLIGFKKHGKD